jgi:Ca-activated chloride channel family protein
VADSPLGYIDKDEAAKEEVFLQLQSFLQSTEATELLTGLGRRAGLVGLAPDSADPAIWNPDWGIDLTRAIAPIPTPGADVIGEALSLYQTELRKPSLTVWVLDVSGSMEGAPLSELKQAMTLLLDPQAAAVNLLQPSSRDVTIVLPFNHNILASTTVEGSDKAELAKALSAVQGLQADGGTDVYYAIYEAFEAMSSWHDKGELFDYLPAIVAMTDGASSADNREGLMGYIRQSGFAQDVPIHAIAFGNADEAQLNELSQISIGRMFKAGDDLAAALRKAKGYN